MTAGPTVEGRRVTYTTVEPFRRAMSSAVGAELRREGIAARGGFRLWAKAVIMIAWMFLSYAVLVWVPLSPIVAGLATVSLGLAGAGVGMSVKHDAVHQAFSRRPGVNAAIAQLGTAYGLSAGWWRQKHNRLHHGYTNVAGLDDDLDIGSLARLSLDQPWHRWHRWQHVYLWGLYPFLALGQFLGADLRYVLLGRIGPHQLTEPGLGRVALGLVDKFKGPVILLGLALTTHPVMPVLAVFLSVYLVAGMALALTFIVEHTVDATTVPDVDPRSGEIRVGRAEAQVVGSANLATHNRLLSWYVGSLNHHIEHHLFPQLPHVHLRRIAPVVRQVCADHGLAYHEFPTVRAALASHQRFLRTHGRAPVVALSPTDSLAAA